MYPNTVWKEPARLCDDLGNSSGWLWGATRTVAVVLKSEHVTESPSSARKCFWLTSGWAMRGEAVLAFALADMVALSTGRNGTERGTGPALVLHWAGAGGQETSAVERGERCTEDGRQGRGQESQGGRIPEGPIVTHRPRFCVQSRIPTFHGNFKPVEFVASDFFLTHNSECL